MSISTDLDGLKRKIQTALRYLDQDELLNLVGADQLKWVNENFQKEGIEKPWPPLSPNTIAARRSGSSKPLQDTGRLRQSFVYNISGGLLRLGSNVSYAIFHHFGTKPYQITPKRQGGKLRFMTAGGLRFASKVNHPGLPERRLLPTKAAGQLLAVRSIEGAIDAMRREVNG